LFKAHPSALIVPCRFNQNLHLGNVFEDNFVGFRRKIMSSNIPLTSNPLDVIPDEIPFDVPYGPPISLEQAQAVMQAAVAEAKKRNWKMNVAIADSGGNLVAFQRMDGAMLASIQIAEHKARAAVTFRRQTKVFEDGIQLMHLNYLLAFDGIIASRGGIPLIDQGVIIGAIGCSGGTDSQDEVVSKAGAAVINKLPARSK
jgi:glc operon protein GlcG